MTGLQPPANEALSNDNDGILSEDDEELEDLDYDDDPDERIRK